MRLRTAVAALAGSASAVLAAGALMAGPAVAAPVTHLGGAPAGHQATPHKIAPRDGTTRTGLSLSAFQATFGQESSEVLTVSVGATSQGGFPPTGVVRILDGNTEVCRFTFSSFGGHCSPTDSQLAPGGHSLTAVYDGDRNNFPSSSVPQLLTVVKQQPTATLSLSTHDTGVGGENSVDMTVSVGVAGTAAPTGTVAVSENGALLCSGNLDGNGTATCHMSAARLQSDQYVLVADYSGDGNYNSARSGGESLHVTQDQTSTGVTLPASSLSVSQEAGAQFSYSVTPVVGLPELPVGGQIGIVANTPNAQFTICGPQQITQFTGSCSLAAGQLEPGTYQVTAFYIGDSNFGSSGSDPQTLTITADPPAAAATSTTLALSAAKATFGHEQAERLSVQVNAQSSIPAGKVTVKAGSTSVCTITLAQGKGSCALGATKLRPGKFSLAASYAGGAGFKASTSGTKALTVAAEPTATTLKLSAARVKSGHEQAEHLSVQVKPQFSGTPAGKVTVKAGTVKLCVITLKNGKGTCTLRAKQLRAGTYHLAASYAATAPYGASTSAKKTLTITK